MNILNREFRYTPAAETDVRKTFARERKRLKELEEAQKQLDQEAKNKTVQFRRKP